MIKDSNEKALFTIPNVDLLVSEYMRGSRTYTRIYVMRSNGKYKMIHDSRWQSEPLGDQWHNIKRVEGGFIVE